LPELKAALGAPFLDAWSVAIGAIRDFVNALTDAFREGGALYPVLIQMGAGLSVLADQFAAALGWVTDFVTGLDTEMGEGLAQTAENMLTWGANVVASLAEGIISAASTVLVSALNFIGDVLSSWLSPGSPPKVAPNLGRWGVQAMAEWLHGFTQADFSILEKIQAPLRQILEGPAFVSISGDIIKSMAMTGTIGEEIFARITQAAGAYGQEIVNLIRLQWDLISTTKELESAGKLVEEREQELIKVQDEYYRLRARRAPPEILKAKEDEVKAAQESLSLAEEQAEDAKDRLKTMEGQANLQDLLVKQLMTLGGLAAPPVTAVAAGVGAAAAKMPRMPKMPKMPKLEAIRPEFIMPDPADFDITSSISQAIDAAKAVMEEKMVGIFQPLTDAWQRLKEGPLAELLTTFDTTWTEAQTAWNEFQSGFIQGMDEANGKFVESSEAASTWIGKLGVTFGKESTTFINDFWKAWDTGVMDFNADMESISANAPKWKEDLEGIWESIQKIFGLGGEEEKPKERIEELGGAFGELGGIVDIITGGLDGWNRALATVADSELPIAEFLDLGNIIGALALPEWLRPGSATPFEEALRSISDTVSTEMEPAFTNFSTVLLEQWTGLYSYLVEETWPMMRGEWVALMLLMEQYFRDLVNAVLAGARKMVEAIDRVTSALDRMKDAIREAEIAVKSLTSKEILERFDKLVGKINKAVERMRELEDAANAAAEAVREAASGGNGGGAPAGAAPGLQRGMWNVPRTMTATLHRGERVLPAGLAAVSRTGLGTTTILAPVFLDSRDFVNAAGEVDYTGIGQRLRELEGSL
jgi:hypothetical protein